MNALMRVTNTWRKFMPVCQNLRAQETQLPNFLVNFQIPSAQVPRINNDQSLIFTFFSRLYLQMSTTYNRYLPNISKVITKNWNILQISPTPQKVFDKKPMITYKRNKNLGELIGGHTLQGGKVFKTSPSYN